MGRTRGDRRHSSVRIWRRRGRVRRERHAPLGRRTKFEIIGEALNQLSKLDPALAARIPDLAEIAAFRNLLIHGYADVVGRHDHAALAGPICREEADQQAPERQALDERAGVIGRVPARARRPQAACPYPARFASRSSRSTP